VNARKMQAGGRPRSGGRKRPPEHVVLLDTSSLLYRAFYSIPSSVTDPRGRPVNAVHGYLDMTARLIRTYAPTEVMHVYDDDWRPAPRVKLYAGYKAHRPDEPDEISRQFDVLGEVLDALGASQASAPGWEAEDAIGALCARADERTRIDIVSGDRDLLQLVRDPAVRVLFTVKGVSDLRVMDEAGVEARYGVPAGRYADFAILRGDPSDGLPGVRGVGEKTARLLVRAYPNLRSLVDDATAERRSGALLQRSPALRAAIRDAAAYVAAMEKVVPIRSDVKVRTWGGKRDDERLAGLAKRHGLGGPIRRLVDALG
jgi:5'-3' exonuclease